MARDNSPKERQQKLPEPFSGMADLVALLTTLGG
jgi:hypothetical protein